MKSIVIRDLPKRDTASTLAEITFQEFKTLVRKMLNTSKRS